MQAVLKATPILSPLGIAVCSASVIINIWIFFVLRSVRATSSSSTSNGSGRVYNLALIRHLLVTDVITAVLVVTDLALKSHNRQHSAPILPFVPKQIYLNLSSDTDNFSPMELPKLPALPLSSPVSYPNPMPSVLPFVPTLQLLDQNIKFPFNGSSKPMAGYSCLSYITMQCLHSSHALTLVALTLIAIDLYMFVIRALSYRRAFIVRCLPRLLLASWLVCLALAALPILYHAVVTATLPSRKWQPRENSFPTIYIYCRFESDILSRLCCVGSLAVDFNSLQILLLVFITSCCAITFCYVRIVLTICRLAASAPGAAPTSLATAARQNVRGVATSIGLLLMFYALFLPYFALLLTTNMMSQAKNGVTAADVMMYSERMNEYFEVVMSTYTLLNPLVYACRLRAIRRRSSHTFAVLGRRRRTQDSAAQNLMPGSINMAGNNQMLLASRSPTSRACTDQPGLPSARQAKQRTEVLLLPSFQHQEEEEGSVEQHEMQQL